MFINFHKYSKCLFGIDPHNFDAYCLVFFFLFLYNFMSYGFCDMDRSTYLFLFIYYCIFCAGSCQTHLRILRIFISHFRVKKGESDAVVHKICHFLTPILFSDADIDCVSCACVFFVDIFREFT